MKLTRCDRCGLEQTNGDNFFRVYFGVDYDLCVPCWHAVKDKFEDLLRKR